MHTEIDWDTWMKDRGIWLPKTDEEMARTQASYERKIQARTERLRNEMKATREKHGH